MRRVVVLLTVLLVGCSVADIEEEPSMVNVAAIEDKVAQVHCQEFYDWSGDVEQNKTAEQVIASYARAQQIARDAQGTAVGREIATAVELIDALREGEADARDVNDATLDLLNACHAVGWTAR